jgi:hypothetical protein
VSSETTESRWPGWRSWRWIAIVAVAAIVVSVGGTVPVLYATGAFSTEIEAEPIQGGGADPFMPPVGADHPAVARRKAIKLRRLRNAKLLVPQPIIRGPQ